MKKLLLLGIICMTSITFAAGRDLGLGFMVGNPTSLALKYKLENNHSINMGIGFAPFTDEGFVIHADFIHRDYDILPQLDYLNIYYGFGARFSDEAKGLGVGARGVIGSYLKHVTLPMELFFEVAPVFKLFPETTLQLDLGAGVHYFFDSSGTFGN